MMMGHTGQLAMVCRAGMPGGCRGAVSRHARQRVVLMMAVAVFCPLGLAARADAAISQRRAEAIAARVLHPQRERWPVVLLHLTRPVPAGTYVDQGGPGSGEGRSRVQESDGTGYLVTPLRRGPVGHRAWVFWEDRLPGVLFEHPGVLLLLDARTGRVLRKTKTDWWPLINGERPAINSGRAAAARVVMRSYGRPRPARASAGHGPGVASPPGGPLAHAALARGSCVVAVGDFGEPNTRPNFGALHEFVDSYLGNGAYYTAADERSLATAIDNAYADGCRDLVLYISGNQGLTLRDQITHYLFGQGPGPYVSVDSFRVHGVLPGVIKTQILTASDVRATLLPREVQHPDLGVTLIVEACHSGNWVGAINPAGQTPAAARILTSVNADQFSIGPASPRGSTPSPFLGALLDQVKQYAVRQTGATLGQAIGAVASSVVPLVTSMTRGLYDGQWPQSPQYSTSVSAVVSPSRCTSYFQSGCATFDGGVDSGGDGRSVAGGSLRIELGGRGYCGGRDTCEITNCYVCFHLDTAFPIGATVVAVATPNSQSVFARWGPGACSGQGSTCTFPARKDSCIDAQFLLANPTDPPQTLPTIPCAQDPSSRGALRARPAAR